MMMGLPYKHFLFALAMAITLGACDSVSDMAKQLFAKPTPIPTQAYVVQPGDTPKGVALQYCTNVETLITLNAQTYPEMAQVPMKFNYGWKILVPKSCNPGGEGGISVNGGSSLAVVTQVSQDGEASSAQVPTAPAADSAGGYFDYDGAIEIIQLTNEERAAVGLSPLTIDERLMEIARKRAVEIATDWGHQGLSDDCPECGENIGKGPNRSVQSHFDGWMKSEQHHNNMMGGYVAIGAARFIFKGVSYAVQIFHQ